MLQYGDLTLGDQTTSPPAVELTTRVRDPAQFASPIRYELAACWLLAADELPAGDSVDDVRQKLTQPGLPLRISAAGLAALDVRPGGTHPPLEPGVEVIGFSAEPVAGLEVWEIRWQCAFELAAESAAASSEQVQWSESTSVDLEGRSSRTIRAEVAAVGSQLLDSRKLDQQFQLPILAGYRRARREWTIAPDRRAATLEVVDIELDGAASPAGIAAAKLKLSWKNGARDSRLGVTPRLTLHGHLDVTADRRASHAGHVLYQIAATATRSLVRGNRVIVPLDCETEIELYSRRTRARWEFALAGDPAALLVDSGLWQLQEQPDIGVHANNANDASTSAVRLQSVARRGGGAAVIGVDQFSRLAGGSGSRVSKVGSGTLRPPPSLAAKRGAYLVYDVHIRYEREQQTLLHRPAVAVTTTSGGSGESLGDAFQTRSPAVRETLGPPLQTLTLGGRVVRWGELPAIPRLLSVGGREVWETHRAETIGTLGVFAGIPAEEVEFSIRYEATEFLGSRATLATAKSG